MNNIEESTLQKLSESLQRVRQYRPFIYSGRWFLAQTEPDKFKAYRTKRAAEKNSIIPKYWELTI